MLEMKSVSFKIKAADVGILINRVEVTPTVCISSKIANGWVKPGTYT